MYEYNQIQFSFILSFIQYYLTYETETTTWDLFFDLANMWKKFIQFVVVVNKVDRSLYGLICGIVREHVRV